MPASMSMTIRAYNDLRNELTTFSSLTMATVMNVVTSKYILPKRV
jgi:hypothetical protein